MKKKSVTAPLTYDPGKGRPKEHLAYLNYQEMQALKRINGNNQERGPKGLPSFPPGGTTGKSSSSVGSKSTGARGPTGPKGEARASPAGGKAGSVSRSAGIGSARSSSEAKGGAAKSTGAKAGAAKSTGPRGPTGPKGEQRASPARSQAPKSKASESGVRSLNVGPMGTPVSVKTGGAQIKGAIKNVAQAAPVTRAPTRTIGPSGPFGAPGYTGTYNPATGRYDAAPVQTVNRAGKTSYGPVLPSGTSGMWGGPSQTVNRIGKADLEQSVNRIAKTDISPTRISGTATQWGGPTVDVVNRAGKTDLPAATPSLGDTISSYATSVRDALTGAARRVGSMFPSGPVPGTMTSGIPGLQYSPEVRADLTRAMAPYTTGDIAMRNALTNAPGLMTEEYDRAAAEQGLLSALDASKIGRSIPAAKIPDRVPTAAKPALPSGTASMWGGPDIGIDLRQSARDAEMGVTPARNLNIKPMGATVIPEEKILSVEDVPPEAFNYTRVPTTENLLPFQPRTYDTPYPVDENGVPIQNVSEADLAKIRARRRGEEYVPTPQEKNVRTVGNIVSRVVTKDIPFARKVFNVEENIADYQSRPSWEQSYIKERAAASGGIGNIGAGRSSNERETPGGIGNLPTATPTTPAAETTSTSGARPYIYYQWDLGLNVPSPSDPNYTQYQKYLSDRAARRAALGMA